MATEVINWPDSSPPWNSQDNATKILLNTPSLKRDLEPVSLEDIISKSGAFPIRFPTETVKSRHLLESKVPKSILEGNINSTYPLIHENALNLCCLFLAHQRKFDGNREFYEKLDLLQFIDRLLSKRAVCFFNSYDRYLLLDKTEGAGGWEQIGTSTASSNSKLTLENCLSYDEIKLSALLSVSSFTHFLNDGNRHNRGIYEVNDRDKLQEDGGVIIGLIGARFERAGVMEYREVISTREQNHQGNGYGQFFAPTLQGVFAGFYGTSSQDYGSLERSGYFKNNTDRFVDMGYGRFFDKSAYSKRIAISIDTLLIEADYRARIAKKQAYIHVVGLGLGVWKILAEQTGIFMDTFAKRLDYLKDNLKNVSDVCFAYIKHKNVGQYENGDVLPVEGHPDGGIKIHIKNRQPHEKVAGKLLVVSYAWDGNALPGNEFWMGMLADSGDPAAACSTQIAELHNAHINCARVCGSNLRVASLKNGIVAFPAYQEMIRKTLDENAQNK